MSNSVNQARHHPFPKAKYRVKNWGEYDQALQNRGSLYPHHGLQRLSTDACAARCLLCRPARYRCLDVVRDILCRGPGGRVCMRSGVEEPEDVGKGDCVCDARAVGIGDGRVRDDRELSLNTLCSVPLYVIEDQM